MRLGVAGGYTLLGYGYRSTGGPTKGRAGPPMNTHAPPAMRRHPTSTSAGIHTGWNKESMGDAAMILP
jgi:hypothetical protein